MLSRVADHLYWMARYTERAENLARMLDVNCRMTLLRSDEDAVRRRWSSTLETVGQLEPFLAARGAVTQAAAIEWLSFERGNPGSIGQCLGLARENAHAVRGTLTSEAWETLNATWLEFRRFRPGTVAQGAAGDFFEWVKFRSHLARGVIQGTMLADDALEFTWLGTYLERADNTARILDARFLLLAEDAARADEAGDYYEWSALLRSVSAFESYRKVYRDVISPLKVAELLVLRDDLPRGLHLCMGEAYDILRHISGPRPNEAVRLAGEMHAGLHFARMEDIFSGGLHEYLTAFLSRIQRLGEAVHEAFFARGAGAAAA